MITQKKISLPPVIFGTSGLGNLYEATPYERKKQIINEYVQHAPGMPVFDTAGKYGAGLALEVLGKALKELSIPPDGVLISNKLGWYRVPLTTAEPTFEPGVWHGLQHDAEQRISYEGILQCFGQGNTLLNGYQAQMVSVHDPDEYLAAAADAADKTRRYSDILEAYKALHELKAQGKAASVGVGAKNWKTIERISKDVMLDWVMIANSLTVYSHPADLVSFVSALHKAGTTVINSAVFNGGFLVGRDYYNYTPVDKATPEGAALYHWRDRFFTLCDAFGLQPAEACFSFGFTVPGVDSVALSTTRPEKVADNVNMATKNIPGAFWEAMRKEGLI